MAAEVPAWPSARVSVGAAHWAQLCEPNWAGFSLGRQGLVQKGDCPLSLWARDRAAPGTLRCGQQRAACGSLARSTCPRGARSQLPFCCLGQKTVLLPGSHPCVALGPWAVMSAVARSPAGVKPPSPRPLMSPLGPGGA